MSGKLEEIKLLALCMATDNRDAFSRLVEMHQEALRSFLLNLTGGDVYLTDDLAQETFLKAWLAVRAFKGLSGFRTWLFRIAINQYVSYRRKTSNAEPMCALSGEMVVADDASRHETTEASMDVAAALAVLSDAERIVTLLFYMEDMPLKKISAVTSMPEGTVKSHLNRARTKMAEFLKRN